jgi:hypothetical protein
VSVKPSQDWVLLIFPREASDFVFRFPNEITSRGKKYHKVLTVHERISGPKSLSSCWIYHAPKQRSYQWRGKVFKQKYDSGAGKLCFYKAGDAPAEVADVDMADAEDETKTNKDESKTEDLLAIKLLKLV